MPPLADHLDEILEFFRQRTGVAHWVGTVGIGICASGHEYLDEPALAVMLGEFSAESFKLFSGVRSSDDVATRRFECGGRPAHFGIVHVDYDTLARTPKRSASLYRRIIESNGADLDRAAA